MSYATVQAGFAAVIKLITGYDDNNVTEADWRIIGHGKAIGVTLKPGPFIQEEFSMRDSTLITWTTIIELYILWDGELKTTMASLITERQKIIDEVNKYPFLNGVTGVKGAIISSGSEVEEVENSQFLRQTLEGQAVEMNSYARAE